MNRARRFFLEAWGFGGVSILEHEMNRARLFALLVEAHGGHGFNPRARNESCPTCGANVGPHAAHRFNPRARNESCPTNAYGLR
jgi:hypothetical protein